MPLAPASNDRKRFAVLATLKTVCMSLLRAATSAFVKGWQPSVSTYGADSGIQNAARRRAFPIGAARVWMCADLPDDDETNSAFALLQRAGSSDDALPGARPPCLTDSRPVALRHYALRRFGGL
jgi:hypothetical protein